MEFLNLNESVHNAIRIAKGIARDYCNPQYSPAHMLYALMHKEIGIESFISALGQDSAFIREWAEVRIEDMPKATSGGDITACEQMANVFEKADNIRLQWGALEINPICVFTALIVPETGFSADELKSFPLRERDIHDHFLSGVSTQTAAMHMPDDSGGNMPLPKTNLLKYCTNKTEAAAVGTVYPIVRRDNETRMMMEILGRHSKPNVLIIGDAGVGKTAMVDGLACSIVKGNVPRYLKDAVVYELDTGTLIAGATYKGEIEDRLKGIIKELETTPGAILFIDEIHVLIDPKQGNNGAASILKPELSKGLITVIGATTVDEYRKLIEPDHAFNRRFEVLQVSEPDKESTVSMIEAVLGRYIEYHGIKVDHDSLGDCVALAKRYIKERRLPDAAIDLLDRTMAAVKLINQTAKTDITEFSRELAAIEEKKEIAEEDRVEQLRLLSFSINSKLSPILLGLLNAEGDPDNFNTAEQWINYLLGRLESLQKMTKEPIEKVTSHEVAAVISASTGIPIGKIESGEKEKLLNMEDTLRRRVVGQDGALKVLTDAIVESRSGMNKPGQPIGSFFLLGPTGTGKTELAKALAEALFNDEKSMIRLDMSEFKEEHSAALLLGAPPGYVGYEEGGVLVNKIRRQPYAVVLFDEIEKAHSSVYDIFLQIMDEGKLHDRLGKEGDFSNSIVLFTSNVGSEWLAKEITEGRTPDTTKLMEIMAQYFRPEYLARLSEIVPFAPINEDMLIRIFDIQMRDVSALLDKQGIKIEVSEDAKKMLAHNGFNPKYGARQVAGTIRSQIRRPISKMLISGKVTAGNTIVVGVDDKEELTWDIKH
ncbi:ATP-dependent Clp protease ATP-binding subunit [Bacteroides sp. 224]|uniref:ATP-dependent Clp protease ATP-binding subunit n=1 Tax=Bacteroides sp. 224 TaxID=2302936 RepID=UPI0013D71EA0|nr:ATP-dependent Clp protease ATP-binding subunit [Bacteroides sp. 224]NDV64644.1 ATP-dependent Clp protease ATP-binding subunit [Bacteroides sp. 224]